MFTLGFVVFFYCLGSLYDERKDRSILFWKSLPVSDRDTVISKSLTALFVGPLIAIAFALVLSLLVLFSLMVLAAFHGLNLFGLVLGDKNFYLVILQILSFIPVYVLWALPTVGYLLFVSSWAKTKPFLWAVGVPVRRRRHPDLGECTGRIAVRAGRLLESHRRPRSGQCVPRLLARPGR